MNTLCLQSNFLFCFGPFYDQLMIVKFAIYICICFFFRNKLKFVRSESLKLYLKKYMIFDLQRGMF